MIKWKWLIGALIAAGLAVAIFVWWASGQLWLTGQKMARGPNQIAFFEGNLEPDRGRDVYLLDVDSGQMVQLTSSYKVWQMSWSPDGGVIYLSTTSDPYDGLTHQLDPATGTL